MPRLYPAEFRARTIALVHSGKPANQVAFELGIHPVTPSKWIRQDDIDSGARPGVPSAKSVELCLARRRIRELKQQLKIVHDSEVLNGEEPPAP